MKYYSLPPSRPSRPNQVRTLEDLVQSVIRNQGPITFDEIALSTSIPDHDLGQVLELMREKGTISVADVSETVSTKDPFHS